MPSPIKTVCIIVLNALYVSATRRSNGAGFTGVFNASKGSTGDMVDIIAQQPMVGAKDMIGPPFRPLLEVFTCQVHFWNLYIFCNVLIPHAQIFPDIHIPRAEMKSCVAFTQSRQKCKQHTADHPLIISETTTLDKADEARPITAITHDLMPFQYGNLSFVQHHDQTYDILVDMVDLEPDKSDKIQILTRDQFGDSKVNDEGEIEILVADVALFNVFQPEQHIGFFDGVNPDSVVMATITRARTEYPAAYIVVDFESKEAAKVAMSYLYISGGVFRPYEAGHDIKRELTFNLQQSVEFPARVYGVVWPNEKMYAVGGLVVFNAAMRGTAPLLVQKDFHEIQEWRPMDPVYMVLTYIESPSPRINRYSIRFVGSIPEPTETRQAYCLLGHYARTSSHPTCTSIKLCLAPTSRMRLHNL
jgi:hypothetical protein